ncbi:hypothetical protein [Microbacterium sp. gxy059]|uniref:hypothetical protein n=1 Tax=Microbacterium sp. gxy059 TaxID=2957199 RepID=UPI003D96491E
MSTRDAWHTFVASVVWITAAIWLVVALIIGADTALPGLIVVAAFIWAVLTRIASLEDRVKQLEGGDR